MTQLAAVVTFMVVMNAALPMVNGLALAGNIAFLNDPNINLSAIQRAGGCPGGVGTCGASLGGGGVLATLVTFGDFVLGLINLLIQIPITIALPAYVMVADFYAPIEIAAVYNIGFWVILVFWYNDFLSGRYKGDFS